jgi:glucosamine--fructose-6-phosphate aminotransferase (isomerizing)
MPGLMAHEIAEQPAALGRTIESLLARRAELAARCRPCRRVVLYARGTSDHAAVYGRYLIEVLTGRPAALGAPSVATLYRAAVDLRDMLVVVLSQSGATAELVEVAEWAKTQGAITVAITNGVDSDLARACVMSLELAAGPERAVPATKTYTSQLAALAVLTSALVPDGAGLVAGLRRAPQQVERLLGSGAGAVDAAADLVAADAIVSTARGFALSTALEIALKIEETTGIPSLGLSTADLQHGPARVMGKHVPTIVVTPSGGPTLAGAIATAMAAGARGSFVVGIGGDDRFAALCDRAFPGPALPEALAPIGLVVPGQLLAHALAVARDLDPDRPPGLTKVTQTTQ